MGRVEEDGIKILTYIVAGLRGTLCLFEFLSFVKSMILCLRDDASRYERYLYQGIRLHGYQRGLLNVEGQREDYIGL